MNLKFRQGRRLLWILMLYGFLILFLTACGKKWVEFGRLSQEPPQSLTHILSDQEYNSFLETFSLESSGIQREVIGVIEKPNDLAKKAKTFITKKPPFMNGFHYSPDEIENVVQLLKESYPVYAFLILGTNNSRDPPLVIIGGEHGNEPSGVNSALWVLCELRKGGSLTGLKRHFSKIAVIPRYCPYGCNLGLRMGVDGGDPTYHNTLYSEETKAAFLAAVDEKTRDFFSKIPVSGPSPEEKVLKDFISKFGKNSVIVSYHEKGKNNASALLLSGAMTKDSFEAVAANWRQCIAQFGFGLAKKEEFEIFDIGEEGVFGMSSVTPETIGMSYLLNITIEAGSTDFAKRLKEHYVSTINVLQTILELAHENKF